MALWEARLARLPDAEFELHVSLLWASMRARLMSLPREPYGVPEQVVANAKAILAARLPPSVASRLGPGSRHDCQVLVSVHRAVAHLQGDELRALCLRKVQLAVLGVGPRVPLRRDVAPGVAPR